MKKERIKKDVIDIIEDDVDEIKDIDYDGDMKVIESKVKECITFKIVIKDKKGKIIYKDEGNTKEMTKDKIIVDKLTEIYNKVNGTIKIKLNKVFERGKLEYISRRNGGYIFTIAVVDPIDNTKVINYCTFHVDGWTQKIEEIEILLGE